MYNPYQRYNELMERERREGDLGSADLKEFLLLDKLMYDADVERQMLHEHEEREKVQE